MKALLIIDMQNDFSEKGTLPVSGFSELIQPINKRIDFYNSNGHIVIATKDWHPKNHISFKEWGVHCVIGSKGAELDKGLYTEKIDYTLTKGSDLNIDSYSIFKDNANNLLQEIVEVLEKHNIVELEMVGVAGEICVKDTAIDAKELGYDVVVNKTLVRYIDVKNEVSVLNEYSKKGINTL